MTIVLYVTYVSYCMHRQAHVIPRNTRKPALSRFHVALYIYIVTLNRHPSSPRSTPDEMTSRTPGHASITLSRNNVKPLLSTVSNRERYPPSSTTARTEGFRTATNPLHAAANAKTRTKKPFKPPVKVRAPGRNAKTTSQDDLDRSPVSSDSDDVSLKSGVAGSPRRDSIGSRDNVVDVDTLSIGIIASPKRSLRAIGNTNGLPAKSSQEFGSEDSLSGEKRKANEDPEIMVAKPGSEGEDDFGFAFSSGQNTRRARTYQRSSSQRGSQVSFTGNIHGRGGKKQTGKAVESTKKGKTVLVNKVAEMLIKVSDLGSFKMPNLGENGTSKSRQLAEQKSLEADCTCIRTKIRLYEDQRGQGCASKGGHCQARLQETKHRHREALQHTTPIKRLTLFRRPLL